MKKFTLGLLFASATTLANFYDCELKARQDLMDPFEIATLTYDGGIKPARATVKNFELIVQKTESLEGVESLTLWLGSSDYQSAVSQVAYGAERAYLNIVQGNPFAVASCKLSSSMK